jgi:hypothetical protein
LHAGLTGEVARDGEQPRLAHSSGRFEQHDAPTAVSSLSQALLDRGKLGVALDQYTAEAACATAPTRLNSPS